MAIEANMLTPQPHETGLTPQATRPPITEIPFHLRRETLMKVREENGKIPEILITSRATAIERRGLDLLIEHSDLFTNVRLNPPYTKGSDIKFFVGEIEMEAEIKSHSQGIQDAKDKIRKSLPVEERNEYGVRKFLTKNRRLLINATEYKSDDEIYGTSVYPQLARIIVHTPELVGTEYEALAFKRLKEYEEKLGIMQIIQIFPELKGGEE